MNDESRPEESSASRAHGGAAAVSLAGHLLELSEREKEALARALHDELGSSLTAINLDVASVAGQLPEGVARTRLERALRVLKEAVELKRRLIQSLRPSMIDSLGLVATLRMEAEAFEARSGIACAARFSDEPAVLDPRVAMALYRVVQDTLRRLETTARASRVTIDLAWDEAAGTHLLVIETDDPSASEAGIPFQALYARMRHLGGGLQCRDVGAHARAGVRLVAQIPAAPPRDADAAPA